MQSVIPPIDTLTLPSGAGPGDARIVIGPALPPPLDSYVFNGDQTYAGGIIFYAEDPTDLDNNYTFLCVVEDGADQDIAIHVGHVNNGAVVDDGSNNPYVQKWILEQTSGNQTFELSARDQLRLTSHDSITVLSTGAGDISISPTLGGVSITTPLGPVFIDAVGTLFFGQNAGNHGLTVAAGQITINASNANSDVIQVAADLWQAAAGGTARIQGPGPNSVQANASGVQIETQGTGDDITLTSVDDITITASDTITLDPGAGGLQVAGDTTMTGTLTVTGNLSAGNMVSGQVSITPTANTPTAQAVSFGTTFTATPRVFATAVSSVPGSTVIEVSANNITTTGCDIVLYRTNNNVTLVNWFAVGQTI